jgi:hypothetical protein
MISFFKRPHGGRTFSRREKAMAKAKTSAKTVTKKVAVKTASKKTEVKKTAKKTAGVKEGSRYCCAVCGLAVTVDTACGCAETAHLICCEKPMRMKK